MISRIPLIKAIIFDMDDTLYPEGQYVLSGFKAVALWAEDFLKIPFQEGYGQLKDYFYQGIRGNTFNLFLNTNNLAKTELIEQMIQVYREHEPKLTPFPEVIEILRQLHPHFKLGLITDGYLDVQKKKWAALRLEHHVTFDAIVFSDQWGRDSWKPSHRPFIEAMKCCTTTASETLYIGDNPTKDFLGAKQLGIFTIMVQRSSGVYSNKHPPTPAHASDMNINDFKQLPNIVNNLKLVQKHF